MSLNKALQDLKFDKRLVDLNLKQGRITKEDLENYNKSLPDLSAECEKIEIEKADQDSVN